MKQKVKNIKKLLLHLVMFPLFVVLVLGWGSIAFHEIAGAFFFVLLSFHLMWNQKFISSMKKMKGTTGYFRSFMAKLLILGIYIIAITGMLISRVLLPNELYIPYYFIAYVHKVASYFVMGNVIVHILDHIPYFRNTFAAICELKVQPRMLRIYGSFICLMMLMVVSYKEIYLFFSSKTDELPSYIVPSITIEGENADNSAQGPNSFTDIEIDTTLSVFEFLNSLTCEGCGKHCSLMIPRCSIGINAAEIATNLYEEKKISV